MAEVEVLGCPAGPGCENPPVVSVTPVDATTCGGTGSVTISTTSGTVEVLDDQGNAVVDLNNVEPGAYLYSVTDGACIESGTFSIGAPDLPVVSIDPAGLYFSDQGVQTLSATPVGGSWGGSANPDGTFDPSQGVGEYVVTYSYTDPQSGCSNSDQITITVAEPGAECVVPENVALNKPASQSSDKSATKGQAGLAVDGNTDGSFPNGSVTHTLSDAEAWWEVDLEGIFDIETINVWNRTDGSQSRLSNYYVLVSDAPFVSQDLSTTLSQPGVTAYFESTQAGSPTGIAVGRSGRYVRVQLSGTNFLHIAEVEVLGCPVSEPLQTTSVSQEELLRQRSDQSNIDQSVQQHMAQEIGKDYTYASDGTFAYRLYPNPFEDRFYIEWKTTEGQHGDILVLDPFGKIVYKRLDVSPEERLEIDGRNWAKGAYILQIRIGSETENIRIIKSR